MACPIHVHRLGDEDSTEPAPPLTYCKHGCGGNMHAKCMFEWAKHARSTGETKIKCPLCRTDFGSFEDIQREQNLKAKRRTREVTMNLHRGSTCGGCSQAPVAGPLFQCTVCVQYTLCHVCHNHGTHGHHDFKSKQTSTSAWATVARRQALPEPLVARLQAGELGDSEYTVLNLLDRFHSEPGVPMPPRALSKFPKRTLVPGSGLGLGSNCEICGQQYQIGQQQRTLPCGHDFHCRCIDPWLTTQRSVCPVDGMCVYVPDDNSDGNVQKLRHHFWTISHGCFSSTPPGTRCVGGRAHRVLIGAYNQSDPMPDHPLQADEGVDVARSVHGLPHRQAGPQRSSTAANHERVLPAIDLGQVHRSNRQRRGGPEQEQQQQQQQQRRRRRRRQQSSRVLGAGTSGQVTRNLAGLTVSGSGQGPFTSSLGSGARPDAARARPSGNAVRGGTMPAPARHRARGLAGLSVMGIATSAPDAMDPPAAVVTEAGARPVAAAASGLQPRAALVGRRVRREGGGAAEAAAARAIAPPVTAAAPRARGQGQPPMNVNLPSAAAGGPLPQLTTTTGRGHVMNPASGRSMGGATKMAVAPNRGTFAKAKAGVVARGAPPRRPGAGRLQPLTLLGGVAFALQR